MLLLLMGSVIAYSIIGFLGYTFGHTFYWLVCLVFIAQIFFLVKILLDISPSQYLKFISEYLIITMLFSCLFSGIVGVTIYNEISSIFGDLFFFISQFLTATLFSLFLYWSLLYKGNYSLNYLLNIKHCFKIICGSVTILFFVLQILFVFLETSDNNMLLAFISFFAVPIFVPSLITILVIENRELKIKFLSELEKY